jgi:hypothetical protein
MMFGGSVGSDGGKKDCRCDDDVSKIPAMWDDR